MTNGSDSFTPIHNPYIVGNPIRGSKMFFGREDNFAYVHTKFSGRKEGGLIVLCGARRSGKTSILFQIQDGRLGDEFVPVLIDMQSMAIDNDVDFIRKAAQLIAGNQADPLLTRLDTAVAAGTTNPYSAFEVFIRDIGVRLGQKRLLLAVDEYELIETHIDAGTLSTQALNLLANMIEHYHVFVVFTGSDQLESRDKPYWDPFLSKALYQRISFLTPGDTLRLIREPLDGTVHYRDGVPERIAFLTAGQPFYTQVICQNVVDRLNEKERYDVTLDDVERVVEYVIENPLPQMIFHWNALGPPEKFALSIVAELNREESRPVDDRAIRRFAAEEKLGYRFNSKALKKTLETLFHGDLLDKSTDEDTYSFKMGLWRQWITRMHSVWQVIDEIEREQVPLAGTGVSPVLTTAERRRNFIVAAVVAVVLIAAGVVAGNWLRSGSGGAGIDQYRAGGPTASLAVESEPANAEVWINGALLGKTPFRQTVPAGTLAVAVRAEGYRDTNGSLILGEDADTTVTFALVASTGNIRVVTEPPGALVSVDGAPTGEATPMTARELSVTVRHDIDVRLEGYSGFTFRAVQVFEDSTIELSHVMARRTAPLTVVSNPAGAMLVVDGAEIGATPQPLERLTFGEHELVLRHDGYEEWRGAVDIPQPDNRFQVTLTELAPGYLRLSVVPYGEIFVDGVRQASGSYYLMKHKPGNLVVEFRHPQYGAVTKTVQLAPGDTLSVEHVFK